MGSLHCFCLWAVCPMVVAPASTWTAALHGPCCLRPSSRAQATRMLSAERQHDQTSPTLLLFVYVHRSLTNIK